MPSINQVVSRYLPDSGAPPAQAGDTGACFDPGEMPA
jgi:hypothetical protein